MRRVVVRVWVKQGYISGVPVSRQCSRTACSRDAVATLTYVYSDSTVVVGPLAVAAEPHSYDLCEEHASRLTAPRGWEVVRVVAPSGREVDKGAVQSRQAHPAGGSRSRDGARAVAVDAVEERRREISRPLHAPRDDWAVLADVVSSASEVVCLLRLLPRRRRLLRCGRGGCLLVRVLLMRLAVVLLLFRIRVGVGQRGLGSLQCRLGFRWGRRNRFLRRLGMRLIQSRCRRGDSPTWAFAGVAW